MGTGDVLDTDKSIISATEAQNDKLPTVQHVKDYVDTRVTSIAGMVQFNPSSNTYKLEVSSDKINMSFGTTFKARLKFVKIDDTFKKYDIVTDSIIITSGSLVQIGYADGGKLVITEPAWVEIKDIAGKKSVGLTHSI